MLGLEWVTVNAHCDVELYVSTSHQLAFALFKHIDGRCSRTRQLFSILFSSILDPRAYLVHGIESQVLFGRAVLRLPSLTPMKANTSSNQSHFAEC